MYQLTTESSFDSAHFLAGYNGKCSNLHGHRWRVVATIEDTGLADDDQCRGMLVDFGQLKEHVKALTDQLDHKLIIETGSLKPATITALEEEGFLMVSFPFRPTAENLSRYFYDRLVDMGYRVSSLSVYETPNNCATYSADREK